MTDPIDRAWMPEGVMVALVTPLDDEGRLDEPALERLVERVLSAGVRGVCPTGSTGEGARLSRPQRLAVAGRVVELVAGRVPVLPGVPLTSVAEGLEELASLAGLGARAALVAPPSYYPLSDGGVERLFTELAVEAPLDIVLYNIPVYTNVTFPVPVVESLAGHARVVGIKDSSRDMEYLSEVIAATRSAEDFAVLTGSDTLLVASVLLGARGAIAASANLVPRLGVALYEAVAGGDLDAALGLQRELFAVVKLCRQGEFPAGWKAALEVAGLCSGRLVEPGATLAVADRERLGQLLAGLEVRELTPVP